MIFAKENAAACSINEYQIIVAGGKTPSRGRAYIDTVKKFFDHLCEKTLFLKSILEFMEYRLFR